MGQEMQQPYVVFVKADAENRITAIDSSEFLSNTDGWVEVDRGHGFRYRHAQGNYLARSLTDDDGVYRYKLVDGKPVERSPAEMDADRAAMVPDSSGTSNNGDRIDSLEQQIDMLLKGATSDGKES